MIRVLVVDDSPTARALIMSVLRADSEIQVVGEAGDGVEAVSLTQKLRPDIVTMDIHMPRMDGLTATKEVMINSPTPIIIITGTSSVSDVSMAMNSLRAGAVTLLRKPRGPGGAQYEDDAQQLRDTVKAMAAVKVVRHWRGIPGARAASSLPATPHLRRDRLIGIAASTGGPEALHHVLSQLPSDFATPVLVVQHITCGFANGLAEWLNTMCDIRVKFAEQGETLVPRTAYLAPDDRHLGVSKQSTVLLSDGPPVGGFRPAASHLFDSLARTCGAAVTAVILSGMGSDGVEGLRSIRQAGGRIIAQDEKTSIVWGMPGAAVAAGVVTFVLPLEEIAARLVNA